MTLRFYGFIHSIIGESIMLQPKQHSPVVERGSITDFESIIPTSSPGQYCFHPREGRHYAYAAFNPQEIYRTPAPTPAAPQMPATSDEEYDLQKILQRAGQNEMPSSS